MLNLFNFKKIHLSIRYFRKGKNPITIEPGGDPFYLWINDNDKIENYELEGAKFTFAKMDGSNIKGMKMIVPAK